MTRPVLLDLFCGAGGAAMGYSRAGFDVIGIDSSPQPHYPFEFYRMDAFYALSLYALPDGSLDKIDAIHASPPCQAHSDLQKQNKRQYKDHIPGLRAMLKVARVPYIIENVEGAPLLAPVMLCGSMFPELRVYRHRLFESSVPLSVPEHLPHRELTFTHDKRKRHYGRPLDLASMRVQVTGGGNAPVWAKRQAMGIDWMTGREINEAIPPAYTEHIGAQLMAHVLERAA